MPEPREPSKIIEIVIPHKPKKAESKKRMLPDEVRSMGIHIAASKGSGKSRMLGRILAYGDFRRGVPTVMFDSTGPTISNFLDKITRLPATQQKDLWQRIRYIDMSGQSQKIIGFPLYYRLGNENLFEVASRFITAIEKLDPHQTAAPVLGMNAIKEIGISTGMILAALGYQITEAEMLLIHPKEWASRFNQALAAYPEVKSAVDYFNNYYLKLNEKERPRVTQAFRNKISMFSHDPGIRAMFGTNQPGIDWQEIVESGVIVLLDFSRELEPERRRFKMMWSFLQIVEWIKFRGAGRHKPLSIIVDELTALYNFAVFGAGSIFATELDELINIHARNHSIWLTLAHQEMYQLDPKMQKTVLTMGTQIFGSSTDYTTAVELAKTLFQADPHQVKRWEPIYATQNGVSKEIDKRPVYMSLEEQRTINAQKLKNQRKFHFLMRLAQAEGDIDQTQRLLPFTIENIDKGEWVNDPLVNKAKKILRGRTGILVEQIRAEIQARLDGAGFGTLREYGQSTNPPVQPTRSAPAKPISQPPTLEEDNDDDLYQAVRK